MAIVYSKDTANVAEIHLDSHDPFEFALNCTAKYADDRIGAIFEPIDPGRGILDIPALLFTPLVFTYYLLTSPFKKRKNIYYESRRERNFRKGLEKKTD
jgi:hypothetical protein